jgi:hypothetical protein
MRELSRRLRSLEEARDVQSADPPRTLADFYKSIHDPADPHHESTVRSLAYFYGDLRQKWGVKPTLSDFLSYGSSPQSSVQSRR